MSSARPQSCRLPWTQRAAWRTYMRSLRRVSIGQDPLRRYRTVAGPTINILLPPTTDSIILPHSFLIQPHSDLKSLNLLVTRELVIKVTMTAPM